MTFCARRCRTITAPGGSPWRRRKSSSATGPRATWATSSTCSTRDNTVLVPDPVYPVYVDTNRHGRAAASALWTPTEENGFLPLPDPAVKADHHLSLLPQQPHRRGLYPGAARSSGWTTPARKEAVILFDAAYEAFVADPTLPRSIFEIEGAQHLRHRVLLPLQNRRLHRHPLRLHRGAPGAGTGRPVPEPACGCAARPPNSTACPTSSSGARRRCSPPRGSGRSGEDIAYYRENARVIAGALRDNGRVVHRRGKFALYLAEVPGRDGFLGASSTGCWSRPMWWAPPARASAKTGRASSG